MSYPDAPPRWVLTVMLAGSLAGCGGNVVVDGTGSTTSTNACMVLSTTPVNPGPFGCNPSFSLAGGTTDCGVPAGGALDPSKCKALCPPNPQMQTALSCTVSGPIGGVPGGALLNCTYPCG